MVTYDPLLGVFCRMGASGQPEKYHVLFFGNLPQRAWIGAKSLKLWEGAKGAGNELREQQTIPKRYELEWPPALRFALLPPALPSPLPLSFALTSPAPPSRFISYPLGSALARFR